MRMADVVRHGIGLFTDPLLIALLVAVAGAGLGVLSHRRAMRSLFAAAALLAYAGSTAAVGDLLIRPLELRYPPLAPSELPRSIKYVVVLGSGFDPYDDRPITATLDADGLARIVEGVRLERRLPNARLVVSGGVPGRAPPPALGYAILAHDLGIPHDSVVVLDKGRNTLEEAQLLAATVGHQRFLLVTSAYQMPRAVSLTRRYGLAAVPAPTGQSTHYRWEWNLLLPDAGGVRNCERALHEYLGLAALALHLE